MVFFIVLILLVVLFVLFIRNLFRVQEKYISYSGDDLVIMTVFLLKYKVIRKDQILGLEVRPPPYAKVLCLYIDTIDGNSIGTLIMTPNFSPKKIDSIRAEIQHWVDEGKSRTFYSE